MSKLQPDSSANCRMIITDLIDQLLIDRNIGLTIKWLGGRDLGGAGARDWRRGNIWGQLNGVPYLLNSCRLWYDGTSPNKIEIYQLVPVTPANFENGSIDIQTCYVYALDDPNDLENFYSVMVKLSQLVPPLSAIVAMDKNQCIGKGNALPWRYPEDLKWFKNKTKNSIVLMGNRTYKSIGKPLPNRYNAVLTSSIEVQNHESNSLGYFPDLETFWDSMPLSQKCFVIGGASVYSQTLPLVTDLYVTQINKEYDGDTFFPPVNWQEWGLVESIPGVNPDLTFQHYKRILPNGLRSYDPESSLMI